MTYISSKKDTKQISMTIYNQNLALIRENRKLDLQQEDELYFLDVPSSIHHDSIMVQGIDVFELNYESNVISRQKLLERYIGDEFTLVKNDGTKSNYRLLSVKDGIVAQNLKTDELSIDMRGEMVLPFLPKEFQIKPSLKLKVSPSEAKEMTISYLCQGFTWSANYIACLGDESLHFVGRINIKNNSGSSFDDVQLKLIAGEVKIQKDLSRPISRSYAAPVSSAKNIGEPEIDEQTFYDYHLYTLPRPVSLKNNQSKQVNFLTKSEVVYQQYYQNGIQGNDVDSKILLKNKQENGLGIPLPQGKVKCYRENQQDGHLEFIGECQMKHLAVHEQVSLDLGKAFDVTYIAKKVDVTSSLFKDTETYEYKINNAKQTAIRFRLKHNFNSPSKIIKSSDDFTMIDVFSVEYWLDIPAQGEKVVRFTYRKKI